MIRKPVGELPFTMEVINDPLESARCRDQQERGKRNSDWLQAHWPVLLPKARGKFVAVAGQEAFIADTAEEAGKMARTAHPQDDGAISQYVFPEGGLRVYSQPL